LYGGLGALGVAYDKSPGVVGIINFAGGAGSIRPGEICSGSERLIAAVGRLGEGNLLPQMWLYAANDHYFEPSLAHAMVEAYRAGSRAHRLWRPRRGLEPAVADRRRCKSKGQMGAQGVRPLAVRAPLVIQILPGSEDGSRPEADPRVRRW
jgi:hypothetical protein